MNAPTLFSKPVLSLFPGVGLLDRAFEEAGFCVVRGPDLIFGGDVRRFRAPAGVFGGVIGGPPCQDFSSLRRAAPTGDGLKMLGEFCRIVAEAAPDWFLCENVARVPDVVVAGYHVQRLDVDQRWFDDVSRLRHIQFGSRRGELLHVDKSPDRRRGRDDVAVDGAATASDARPLDELIRLQGLPPDFTLPGFTVEAAKRAVGNGVPLALGRVLAAAVVDALARGPVPLQRTLELFAGGDDVEPAGVCACGCGRRLSGSKRYYDFTCRKRAQRKRDRARARPGRSHFDKIERAAVDDWNNRRSNGTF